MKNKVAFSIILVGFAVALTAAIARNENVRPAAAHDGAWMQVYQFVAEPPRVQFPPEGWQRKLIPSGQPVTFYAYEVFADEHDWITGQLTGEKILVWKRACFFLPDQEFEMQQLGYDNQWFAVQIIRGPMEYFNMDGADGDEKVFRLVAK